MANFRLRWSVAACVAVLAFVACWAVLKFLVSFSGGDALGWAVVPFSIVLALGGGWADQARRHGEHPDSSSTAGHGHVKSNRVVQKQRATKNARQLQEGTT